MRYIASVSFGKDSLAMLLLLIEKQYPLDEVVFYDTGMEFQAVYDTRDAVQPLLAKHDIKYTELRPEYDFLYKMFDKPVKGKQNRSCNDCVYCETVKELRYFNPSFCKNPKSKFFNENDDSGKLPWNKGCPKHDNGKSKITHYGYSWCGGRCRWGTTDKLKTLDRYAEQHNAIVYVGIAADEPARLTKEHKEFKRYPLYDWNTTEKDALEICYNAGFEWREEGHRLYDLLDRVSCWCCANKNLKELRNIYRYLPNYWKRLKDLQSRTARPMKGLGKSVFDLEKRFAAEIAKEQEDMQND